MEERGGEYRALLWVGVMAATRAQERYVLPYANFDTYKGRSDFSAESNGADLLEPHNIKIQVFTTVAVLRIRLPCDVES